MYTGGNDHNEGGVTKRTSINCGKNCRKIYIYPIHPNDPTQKVTSHNNASIKDG